MRGEVPEQDGHTPLKRGLFARRRMHAIVVGKGHTMAIREVLFQYVFPTECLRFSSEIALAANQQHARLTKQPADEMSCVRLEGDADCFEVLPVNIQADGSRQSFE